MRTRLAGGLLLFIAASLLVTPLFAQSPQSGWKEYSYANDGFAVSAPAEPAFAKQDKPTAAGNVETHNYTIELGNNSGVMISSAQFQGQTTESSKMLLQRARDGALNAVNGKLVSEQEITLQGFPGLEFQFANDAFHARVRMYLLKTRLVTSMAIAPKGSDLPANADKVLSSLKLLPPPGKWNGLRDRWRGALLQSHMMAYICSADPEDHVFSDVGSVVGHALKISCNQQQVKCLLDYGWILVHLLD